jgi:uncharacterized protein (TIGR00255 family)
MIHSMTGYGKGQESVGGAAVRVEVRTVNHRFLEFTTRLPRALYGREKDIERAARDSLRRGHVYITVTMDKALESEGLSIDFETLRRVYWALSTFASREGISGGVRLDALLSVPEIVSMNPDAVPSENIWPAVRKALTQALDACMRMRASEGAEIERDLAKRIARINKTILAIDRQAAGATKRAFAKAKRRIRQLAGNVPLDESRLLTEAAVMADRIDFSEELVRLKSHIKQFEAILSKGGETSKKLTFLLQEIHREATTMGNKAAEAPIIRQCILIKESVEKLREQIQNIE